MKNIYCIYGINNSIALLSSNNYTIISINVLKGGVAIEDKNIKSKLDKSNTNYFNKDQFYLKYNFKHTQGIVVEFKGEIIKEFDEVDFNEKNMCYIILDKINDPQNLGQIIRTCECSGVDGIILPRHGSVHITNSVLQVSQGAFMNIDLFVVTNISNIIAKLKENGFWIAGLENSIEVSKKWYEIDYTDRIGIVFGSEAKGIRKLVLESCDFLSTIPMMGRINSLNVSAAVSAVLFERQRQLLIKN